MATRSRSKSADEVDDIEAQAAGDRAVTPEELNDVLGRSLEGVEAANLAVVGALDRKCDAISTQVADLAGQVQGILDGRRQHDDEEQLRGMVTDAVAPLEQVLHTLTTRVTQLAGNVDEQHRQRAVRETSSGSSGTSAPSVSLAASQSAPAASQSAPAASQSAPAVSIGSAGRQAAPAGVGASLEMADGFDRGARCKLPPFDGREKWSVYFKRFDNVRRLRGWGSERALTELISHLQGEAATFVFDEMPAEILAEMTYDVLAEELSSRFSTIESSKSYAAQFANCRQMTGQSIEDFVATLKKLYTKGFTGRAPRTRQEDLLRRFLDGLLDENARHSVEFVKNPATIEEAAREVIVYQQSKQKFSEVKKAGATRRTAEAETDDAPEQVARVVGRKKTEPLIPATTEAATSDPATTDVREELRKLMAGVKEGLQEEIRRLTPPPGLPAAFGGAPVYPSPAATNFAPARPGGAPNQSSGAPTAAPRAWKPTALICYGCRAPGHMKRDCPHAARPPVCYICNQEGHISPECSLRRCAYCGVQGHHEHACPARASNKPASPGTNAAPGNAPSAPV